jgi:hypothetical protein
MSFASMFLVASVALAQAAPPQAKKKPAASAKPAPAAPALQLDPKALEILKATSDKLAGAHTLSFTAVELFEHLTRQGSTYYLCGNTWFSPSYGAGGVSYKVVPTP